MSDNVSQPSRNPANGDEMAGAMREILSKFLNGSIDDSLPAKIVSYDRATNRATVQPLIAVVSTDGSNISRNQLSSIPVFNIGGGGFILSFNLNPGDLGWIKATDRDIADFLKSYKESVPSTNRVHDFNNGIFIPDVMTGYDIAGEDADSAVLQSLDGVVRISLFSDKIKITSPEIIFDSPTTTATGDVQVNQDLNVDGAAALGGAGGAAIARVGDSVVNGVITTGSSTHTAT